MITLEVRSRGVRLAFKAIDLLEAPYGPTIFLSDVLSVV